MSKAPILHMRKDDIEKHERQFITALKTLKNEISERKNLTPQEISEQLECVDLLSEFPLGRYLIVQKSFSSYWTDYLMSYCEGSDSVKPTNRIEEFLLKHSLMINGWRECFQIFKKLMQDHLKSGITLVSVPCGEMRDVLSLDFTKVSDFKILGLDLDPSVIDAAKKASFKTSFSENIEITEGDAWHLPYREVDLISSCGLNIYISDRKRNLDLYREFYRILGSNGTLIISFLTYPCWESESSEWKLEGISPERISLEKTLYNDILELECRNYSSTEMFKKDLMSAGFSSIEVYSDKHCIFPTVLAKKEA